MIYKTLFSDIVRVFEIISSVLTTKDWQNTNGVNTVWLQFAGEVTISHWNSAYWDRFSTNLFLVARALQNKTVTRQRLKKRNDIYYIIEIKLLEVENICNGEILEASQNE